jgi:K+-sensing histidine kinase KdpD
MALLPLDLRGAPEADVVLRPPIYLDEVVRWCIRASRGPMAEEILEDMAAGLSHEIGNPLTSLFLQIDMLKADSGLDTVPDQLDLAEHLGLIEESARRIEAVVRDVASAAVRQPVRADATALGEFLEETLRCLAERSPGFEARVDVTCSDEDILVDRVLLRGALADVWEYMLRAGEPDERLVIDAASLASGSLRIDALSRTTRLPSDAADRLFTPLWARQALGLPEGISLTSARNAFRRNGGELRARSAGEELLCVEALLPASEAADPTRAGSES